jgi:metallo-beta-lactamase class B
VRHAAAVCRLSRPLRRWPTFTLALCLMAAVIPVTSSNPAYSAAYRVDGTVSSDATSDEIAPLLAVCQRQSNPYSTSQVHNMVRELLDAPRVQPAFAFDNLAFVGTAAVSAWVITNNDGLILIDSLDNAQEARDTIVTGLGRLHLDPKAIRYIVVTHAHGDHYGGAASLAETFRSRIVMSDVEWSALEKPPKYDDPLWGRPPVWHPERDIAIHGHGEIRLGNTVVELVTIPGHTWCPCGTFQRE